MQETTVATLALADYLALCHSGCPVPTFSMHGTLLAVDPYCSLHQNFFRYMEQRARPCDVPQA